MLYHIVFDLCRESGFEPQFSFASHNIKSILNLVKNNEGISVLMHDPEKTKDITYVPIKPAMLLIEHDKYFIEQVADQRIVISN